MFGLNIRDERDGFAISYNPMTDVGEETAICFSEKGDNVYKILLGDFRKEYENKSLVECLEIFEENITRTSKWSN